jgi:hypothetical protein
LELLRCEILETPGAMQRAVCSHQEGHSTFKTAVDTAVCPAGLLGISAVTFHNNIIRSATYRSQEENVHFVSVALRIRLGSMKKKNSAAAALGRKGGKARARNLSPEELSEQGRKAVQARWKKIRDKS